MSNLGRANYPELADAIQENVRHAPRGEPFRLKSGRYSTWYVDCRPVSFGQPWLVGESVNSVLVTAGIWFPPGGEGWTTESTIVGGPAVGATPIATAAAMWRRCRSFTVRTAPKDHGGDPGSLFVGPARPGDRIVLVEDVLTTGGSLERCWQEVADYYDSREMPFEVVAIVILLNRVAKGEPLHDAEGWNGVPLISILRPEDVGAPVE